VGITIEIKNQTQRFGRHFFYSEEIKITEFRTEEER
jgi:hypothetical protein